MSNTTTTTTSGIDPEFKKFYATLLSQGEKNIYEYETVPDPSDPTKTVQRIKGVKPFQQYQGEQIAGFTPQQLAVQQQMAQLQTPQGFTQGAQGLNQAQQMAFAAGNQGFNQAFGYQPQAPASLAIPQQAWFPSGSNAPQQAQPAAPNPFQQGLNSTRSPQQTPQQQQDFQQGMGITNVGGQLTFADTASPFVSSATPQSAGQGLVDARLASRGTASQSTPIQQPINNGNGGFGPMAPQQIQPQGAGATPDAIAFNRQFAALNNIPYDFKQNQEAQKAYFLDIAGKNQAAGGSHFKMPQGFAAGGKVSPYTSTNGVVTGFNPASNTVTPATTTQTPQQQQDFQQGMGITNVGGQLTFADTASPFVSSATPQSAGQGLVDARLASRGMAPQTTVPTAQPTAAPISGYTNAPGGFGHMAIIPNTSQPPVARTPQQYVNNGNGGFGPANPVAPVFGQQPDSSAYESRYQQGVTDIALREGQRQADLQRQAGAMSSIGRGTFGGARQALIQSEADRNNAQNMAAIQAMGSQAGFQNAQQQFNADRASNIGVQTQNQNVALQQQQLAQQGQQFQAGLGRDIGIAGLHAGIGSSANLGNLSAAQQQGDLARLQMQGATAAQQQALQQQINDRAIQDYYTAQQYPMQQLDRYGNILRGNQGAMGSVGTTTTPQGSVGAQILGGVTAAAGIYGQNPQAINSGLGSLWNLATGGNNAATNQAMNAFGY